MPLTVESYAPGGKDAQEIQASRVLVKDPFGNPLCVVVEYGENQYLVSHCEDFDFEHLVQTFGYTAPTVLKTISAADL